MVFITTLAAYPSGSRGQVATLFFSGSNPLVASQGGDIMKTLLITLFISLFTAGIALANPIAVLNRAEVNRVVIQRFGTGSASILQQTIIKNHRSLIAIIFKISCVFWKWFCIHKYPHLGSWNNHSMKCYI